MGDTALYPLPGIAEHDLIGGGNIRNFALNHDTQATQLKEDIGAMLAVNVDRFGVGSNA